MKKLFPIILLAVVAFCSCDDNVHYLSKSEKPRFHEGDTFYYYSEQAHLTDTFVVEGLHYSFYQSDDDEFECVEYYFSRINKSSDSNMFFYYSGNFIRCKVGDWAVDIYYDPIYKGFNNDKFIKHYIGTEDNNTECNDPLPTKIYHSYVNGFIGYEYPDAIKYDITNPVK